MAEHPRDPRMLIVSALTVTEYVMPEAEAERLTLRITLTAGTLREGLEKLHSLVAEAKAGNAHVALGYPSWTAYLAATLGKEPMRLDRADRQELVGYLAGEGMSTRAIAPIVGASQATVARAVRAPESFDSPAPSPFPPFDGEAVMAQAIETTRVQSLHTSPEPAPEPLPPFDPITGEVLDAEPTPAKVMGLDGKTYTRPEPITAKPRRTPLVDSFFRATQDLCRKAEAITRLVDDDRFPQNMQKVATANRSDLVRAIDALQRVVEQLDS